MVNQGKLLEKKNIPCIGFLSRPYLGLLKNVSENYQNYCNILASILASENMWLFIALLGVKIVLGRHLGFTPKLGCYFTRANDCTSLTTTILISRKFYLERN